LLREDLKLGREELGLALTRRAGAARLDQRELQLLAREDVELPAVCEHHVQAAAQHSDVEQRAGTEHGPEARQQQTTA
jgi:hypothetical protein